MICHERLIIQILEGKTVDVHKLYQKISVNTATNFAKRDRHKYRKKKFYGVVDGVKYVSTAD